MQNTAAGQGVSERVPDSLQPSVTRIWHEQVAAHDIVQWRTRKEKLEREIWNLHQAVADGGQSRSILHGITIREQEKEAITDRLLASTTSSIEG